MNHATFKRLSATWATPGSPYREHSVIAQRRPGRHWEYCISGNPPTPWTLLTSPPTLATLRNLLRRHLKTNPCDHSWPVP